MLTYFCYIYQCLMFKIIRGGRGLVQKLNWTESLPKSGWLAELRLQLCFFRAWLYLFPILLGFKDTTKKIYMNIREHWENLITPIASEALSQRPQHMTVDQSGLGFSHFHFCLVTLLQINREENENTDGRRTPKGKLSFLFFNSLVRYLIGCICAGRFSTIFYLSNNLISHSGYTLKQWNFVWLDSNVWHCCLTPELE